MSGPPVSSSIKLFRDCLRLVKHIAPGSSPKNVALKAMIRTQFHSNKNLEDETAVENAKGAAIRGLANYMVLAASLKDERGGLRKRSEDFLKAETGEINTSDNQHKR